MDIENYIQEPNQQDGTSDLFELSLWPTETVQSEILAINVSRRFLYILTKKNEVYRIDFDKIDLTQGNAYSLPVEKDKGQTTEKTKEKLTKIFCDPEGNHCFIKHNNRMYYFHGNHSKIKEVPGLKDIDVYAMAFDEKNTDPKTTGEMLISDYNSNIYKYKIDVAGENKYNETCTALTQLNVDKKDRIYGLHFTHKKTNPNYKYVIAVTKTKLYQFTGGPEFQTLFNSYKDKKMDNACKIFPISSGKNSLKSSTLSLIYAKNVLKSFGWMTESGFCYGEYEGDGSATPAYVFSVFPYVKLKKDGKKECEDLPITTCHTDNHIYVLYSDCLTVISKITSNIIHTQYFNEPYLDMIYDPNKYVIWLHTSKRVYQLKLENEEDNLWQDYIEIGEYKKALADCKMRGLPHLKKIAKLCANNFFEKGDYNNAAVNYAESDEKFEEVALKLLKKNQLDSLKTYLELVDDGRLSQKDLTQKYLIATWGIEIILNQLNAAEPSKQKAIKDQISNWMKNREKFLDRDTVYQLLQHYGQVELFIEFARIKSDFETIILHYINEKNYKQALAELKQYADSSFDKDDKKEHESLRNIFVRYSHIFMKYEPKETIDILTDQFKSEVDPNKIISAIMNTEKQNYEQVLKYLRSLVKNPQTKEKNIHNLYIFYLSQNNTQETKNELIEYLKKPLKKDSNDGSGSGQKVLFELDYAKKLFSDNPSALALVLALMGKNAEGVKTALEKKDLDTAKFIATNVNEIKDKKALWLDIFKNNKNNNFKTAIEIMDESNILKIEDVLPHIMDNIKIDEFKNQISSCINVYENNIKDLKSDINDYNKTAENIKNDIYKVKKRSMEIQYRQCKCEICQKNIKDDNIFLFPCGHMFDEGCIIQKLREYKEILSTTNQNHSICQKMREIAELKRSIDDIERKISESKSMNDQGKNMGGGVLRFFHFGDNKESQTEKVIVTSEDMTKLEENKEKLSTKLSEECVLCGDYMVESTQCKFVGRKEDWIISI